MTALYPCTQVTATGKSEAILRPACPATPLAVPFGDAFKTGRFRRLHLLYCELWAKFPLFSGELHCRNSEASVSRLIGKFDTTASEREWQVRVSVLPGQGRKRRWHPRQIPSPKRVQKAKAPLPRGVAPRHLHWVTGLSEMGWLLSTFCIFPAGSPSSGAAHWRWLLPGSAY